MACAFFCLAVCPQFDLEDVTSQQALDGYMSEIFLELINSEHIHSADRVDDHLDNPEWVSDAVSRWGLDADVPKAELVRLKSLRSTLRCSIEELMANGAIGDDCLGELNGFLSNVSVTLELGRDKTGALELKASSQGQSPSSVIAQSFAEFVTSADVSRLKLCENTNCRWAFVDTTRNKSKKWCSSAACGNLTKVRRFRAKKAVQ